MVYGKLCLILLSIVLPEVLTQTDYCKKTLCGSSKHVACNNKGNFASICSSNAKIIPITAGLRQQIVNKHNALRNKIAGGFDKFKPAERMATMVWNQELSKLAEYNVKQCQMKHDACHNTKSFKYAGQNLAISSWHGTTKPIDNVLNEDIQSWFNEYKDCSMSYINSFSNPRNGKVIGHFTALVQEKSTDVGCAILRQVKSDGFTEQLMACNYAYTNILSKPVYKSGKAASKCKTGANKKYKFLCSTKEIYNVNTA